MMLKKISIQTLATMSALFMLSACGKEVKVGPVAGSAAPQIKAADGKNGADLSVGLKDPTADDDINGNSKDKFLNVTSGDLFQKDDNGVWKLVGNVKGSQGDKGDTGAVGATGATGAVGAAGVAGAQGAQGAQGIAGVQGASGHDGSSFRSGAGAPDKSLGNSNDSYLDVSSGDLYQKDSNGVWQPIGNAKGAKGDTGAAGAAGAQGAQGAAGLNGSSYRSGAGAPDKSLGNSGDSYLDLNSGDLYQKDSNGVWQLIGNEKGAKGDKGDQGDAGATGAVGPIGAAGAQGASGHDGLSVLTGSGAPLASDGVNGQAYADLNSGDLYLKDSNGVWQKSGSMQGPKGDKGDRGDAGVVGAQSPQGPQGVPGIQGSAGHDGLSVLTGSGAPLASDGAIGQAYLDLDSGIIYKKNADGTWVKAGSIMGPAGSQGSAGAQGASGPAGPAGSQGPAGAQGAQGVAGPQGSEGASSSAAVHVSVVSSPPPTVAAPAPVIVQSPPPAAPAPVVVVVEEQKKTDCDNLREDVKRDVLKEHGNDLAAMLDRLFKEITPVERKTLEMDQKVILNTAVQADAKAVAEADFLKIIEAAMHRAAMNPQGYPKALFAMIKDFSDQHTQSYVGVARANATIAAVWRQIDSNNKVIEVKLNWIPSADTYYFSTHVMKAEAGVSLSDKADLPEQNLKGEFTFSGNLFSWIDHDPRLSSCRGITHLSSSQEKIELGYIKAGESK